MSTESTWAQDQHGHRINMGTGSTWAWELGTGSTSAREHGHEINMVTGTEAQDQYGHRNMGTGDQHGHRINMGRRLIGT